MTDLRATVPKVDALLAPEWVNRFGHARVVKHARAVLEEARTQAAQGLACDVSTLLDAMAIALNDGVQPIINGTGVLLHTNLGRAPWSSSARDRARDAMGYCSVEFDLSSGRRGGRGRNVEDRICALMGAEAALVVNNCAGAVLLMLAGLAYGKTVLVSRGELVEIGGGFRVPDVMAASGAALKEVGTTNRTHTRDFEHAITEDVAGVLRVHHSNFKQMGFVSQPSLAELGALPVPLLVDLGSGQLDMHHNEPSVREALNANADVICMSGDKLLGGPQSGIIIGKANPIETIRRHPMYRALRPDKVILAALEGTVDDWLCNRPVPLQKMVDLPLSELEIIATQWQQALLAKGYPCEVRPHPSTVGGGSLPGSELPSVALAITHPNLREFAQALRLSTPPIIGRVQDDCLLLDVRTIVPFHEAEVIVAGVEGAFKSVTD